MIILNSRSWKCNVFQNYFHNKRELDILICNISNTWRVLKSKYKKIKTKNLKLQNKDTKTIPFWKLAISDFSEVFHKQNCSNSYFIPQNGLLYFYFYRIFFDIQFWCQLCNNLSTLLHSNVFFSRLTRELNVAIVRFDKSASQNLRKYTAKCVVENSFQALDYRSEKSAAE